MPQLYSQESRATLRRRVGSLYQPDRFGYGAVLAATASSVTCGFARRISNGALRGRVLYVVSGTGAGQYADIADNAVGSGVITITPSFTVTPDTTSVIEIWADGIDPEDVNAGLNLAIIEAEPLCGVRVDEPNPTIDATRKILTPNANWTLLTGLVSQGGDGTWREYIPAPSVGWINGRGDLLYTVVGGLVYLSHALAAAPAQVLLSGYRKPAQLVADADICEVPSDYVVFSTCLYLDSGLVAGPTLDPEAHANRSAGWMRAMLVARSKLGNDWEPTLVRLRP